MIAPFISAPGNQNESPLLRDALPEVTRIAGSIGLYLRSTIVSLDWRLRLLAYPEGDFQSRHGAKHQPESRNGNPPNVAASHFSTRRSSRNGSPPLSMCLAGRINSVICCSGSNASASCITPLNHWPMPPLSGVMRTNYQETPVSQRLLADFWWWRFEVDFAGWTDFTGRSGQLSLISRMTRKPLPTHWDVSFRSQHSKSPRWNQWISIGIQMLTGNES